MTKKIHKREKVIRKYYENNSKKISLGQYIFYDSYITIEDIHPIFDNMEFGWHFTYIDTKGPFKFTFDDLDYYTNEIINFEGMTKQIIIDKNYCHKIPINKLEDKERMRLKELKIPTSFLFKLYINNHDIFFGFFDKNSFNVIWIDKKDKVYP